MEILLDDINLKDVKEAVEHLPLAGVTSNPTVVKKAGPKAFYEHMRTVRELIGYGRTLHIQVTATDSESQLKEAERIFEEIDEDVYIKVPVDWEGLKTIKTLKEQGRNVTATAVYDIMQAYAALAAGADYIAVYVNRMASVGSDPYDLIARIEDRIARDGYDAKILAASFHSVQQVRDSLNAGAGSITSPLSVLKATYGNANINGAVEGFHNDWEALYGKGSSLLNVK